jgi:7-cyano-7-deazaguanine synthase
MNRKERWLKAVVLLSGGLDSTVNLACAVESGEVVRAITFEYGQAAFANEARAAAAIARRYGVAHAIIGLPWYRDIVTNPVMGRGRLKQHRGRIKGGAAERLREAWIPNRNGVFLSIGAAIAESLSAAAVVVGFNREEARIFPDNSQAFLRAVNRTLKLSTLSGVKAVCYTIGMTKRQIVALGLEVGAPLDLIYSCYSRSRTQRMCGRCQSCVGVKSALRANHVMGKYAGRFAA